MQRAEVVGCCCRTGALGPASQVVHRVGEDAERVGRDESFFDLGGHSLLLVEVQSRLRARLDREIPILDLFRYPDVASLARHLAGETAEEPLVPTRREHPPHSEKLTGSRDIAVIGLACRFPGAPTLEAFSKTFQAKAGSYEVSVLNPVSKQPTTVRFTLPEGTPRRVVVTRDSIEWVYGLRQWVRIELDKDGATMMSR